MTPKELIEYAKLWGWSRDDFIQAAAFLLNEITGELQLAQKNCAICGGDKVIHGKLCGACN